MNRFHACLALALPALLAATPAAALDSNTARNMVANCANCHGTNGKAAPGFAMATIAGDSKESLVQRMKEFRAGNRPATVMHQIAKGYTDEQIDLIAGYLAAQQK